jgi:hypothetical protein
MRHQTLAASMFEKYCKATRRERFLREMDRVVLGPRRALMDPVYPSADGN